MVLFSLFVIILFISRKNTYTAAFLSLSMVYFYVFYVYPLSLLMGNDVYHYVGYDHSFNKNDLSFAVFSGLLFLLGFFLPDVVFLLRKRKSSIFSDLWSSKLNGYMPTRLDKLFYVILLMMVVYYFVGALDVGRASKGYDIRSGAVQGSWFSFIFSIVTSYFTISLIFCLLHAGQKRLATILFFLYLLFLIGSAPGRAALMMNMVFLLLLVFNIRLKFIILLSVFLAIAFMPIILNLKYIIYAISINNEFPDLIAVYRDKPELNTVLANLGHPLVSLIKVENVVETLGFRYFYDYLQGFTFYLRALGFNSGDSLIYYNTENLIGARVSMIPTGYLSFGYVQFGFVGLVISGIFYRIVGYVSEYVYYSINLDNEAIKFYLVYMAASTFYLGEVRVMIITTFIPLLILYVFRPTRMLGSTQLTLAKV